MLVKRRVFERDLTAAMDDTAKGGLTILGTFYRDSLLAERFQMVIALLFEDGCVSNKKQRLFKARQN